MLDRSALTPLLTEDNLIAEADRLAIEAVRSSEEARAAQLRAERKTAAAKQAGDAAMIAAEAVRMIRTAGLPAAAKRLEEARAMEHALQGSKVTGTEVTGALRAIASSENTRTPPPAAASGLTPRASPEAFHAGLQPLSPSPTTAPFPSAERGVLSPRRPGRRVSRGARRHVPHR